MITLTVNGTRRSFDGDPTMPLPWLGNPCRSEGVK